jgi:ribosomal protein S18 acetylase RimI-like enzyme
MTISIEVARVADAEALVAVQIAAFHHDSVLYPQVEIGGPTGYDSLEHTRAAIEKDDCYTICYDGQIVGVMVVFDKGNGHVHLDLIAIDPAYHNRGIGTQAIHFLEQTYPATLWTLDTPEWAIRNQHFYEKLGFVKVGQTVLPDITLFAYEKRLPARAAQTG